MSVFAMKATLVKIVIATFVTQNVIMVHATKIINVTVILVGSMKVRILYFSVTNLRL